MTDEVQVEEPQPAEKHDPRVRPRYLVMASGGAAVCGGAGFAVSRATASAGDGAWTGVGLLALCVVTWLLLRLIRRRDAADEPVSGGYLVGLWAAAIGLAAVTSYLGSKAGFKADGRSILEVELSGRDLGISGDTAATLRDAIQYDFAFIVAYVAFVSLLVVWAGGYFRLTRPRTFRTTMVVGILVAGGLDAIENCSMLVGLESGTHLWWKIAAVCAWAKLTLVLVGIVYVLAGAYARASTPLWVLQRSRKLGKDGAPPVMPPAMTPSGTRVATRGTRAKQNGAGIALSGGGIRASSISLGALQVFDDPLATTTPFRWSHLSAVTAVSGGSNMASAWSITRSARQADAAPGSPAPTSQWAPAFSDSELPWKYGGDLAGSTEEAHLTHNLGYLLSTEPRGAVDDAATPPAASRAAIAMAGSTPAGEPLPPSARPSALATVFVGMTINTVVLVSMLWFVTRPAGWALRALMPDDAPSEGDHLESGAIRALVDARSLYLPGVTFLLIGALILGVWVALAQLRERRVLNLVMLGCKKVATGSLALGLGLALLLWGFVELVGLAAGGVHWTVGAASGGVAGVLGSVATILKKPAARFAPVLGGIVFGVVGLALAALATWDATRYETAWEIGNWNNLHAGWNWLAAGLVLVVVQLLASPERWSLAAFYRGKLRLAYATRRKANGTAIPFRNDNRENDADSREPSFHTYVGSGAANTPPTPTTPLKLCATSTVSSRAAATFLGTPALSVTFTPTTTTLHVPRDEKGTWTEHNVPTKILDRLGRPHGKRMTTMLASAIASAAVSPAMGRYRIGPTSMLLAFFNIRLGVWIANPRYAAYAPLAGDELAPGTRFPRTGLGYLFKEFFGIHSLDDPYLYLTDGGHWENTGLVEQLRRADVTEIVCIDADCGPEDATNSLAKAIEIAWPECGVRIDITLDPLRALPTGSRFPGYSDRTVNIGFITQPAVSGTTGPVVGVLWYAKPGLTKDMPTSLMSYHDQHPDFPRTGTLDQFFDTGQFNAYRGLGRYNARQILKARGVLLDAFGSGDAYAGLTTTLAGVSDPHWVLLETRRAAQASDGEAAFCNAVRALLA